MYPALSDEKILEKLYSKKEFYAFRKAPFTPNKNKIFDLDPLLRSSMFFRYLPFQHFVANMINPSTPYRTFYIKGETGIGKSLAMIHIAMEQIRMYNKSPETNRGTIFVIGYTDMVFKKELMRRPELGFVTRYEYETIQVLSRKIMEGSNHLAQKLKDIQTNIKKRFNNRINNGYFVFMGYKSFVNQLFAGDLDAMSNMSDQQFLQALRDKVIKVNIEFLKKFNYSMIICDEFHNLINGKERNIYGRAIYFILGVIRTLKGVFASSTPLNNNPTELVDMLNFFVPIDDSLWTRLKLPQNRRYFTKSDFFVNDTTFRESSRWMLEAALYGRISYLRDVDTSSFPARIFEGETIPGAKYLKFTRCPMSALQYQAYKSVYKGALSQDAKHVLSLALPGFENGEVLSSATDFRKIMMAPQEWKDKYGVDYRDDTVIGEHTKLSEIGKYSGKYYRLMSNCIELIKQGPKASGKILIEAPIVHVTGVLYIQNMFAVNGILNEDTMSNDNTLCVYCGRPRSTHSDSDKGGSGKSSYSHSFKPVRMIVLHGGIGRLVMSNLIDKVNNDPYGETYKFIIGSEVIRESIDFRGIRHIKITEKPDHIAMYKQIIGRGIRHGSHNDLPPECRNVHIWTYVTSLPRAASNTLSYEEEKYVYKLKQYEVIQQIERTMHEVAVDSAINFENMLSKNIASDSFILLPFEPKIKWKPTLKLADMDTSSFMIHYMPKEVEIITIVIKRLFIEVSPIWTREDLLVAARSPPFAVEMDPSYFSDDSFDIAMDKLLQQPAPAAEKRDLVEVLYSKDNNMIMLPNGTMNIIKATGNFYILTPANDTVDFEMYMRYPVYEPPVRININEYLTREIGQLNYNEYKEKLYYTCISLNLEEMDQVMGNIDVTIHVRLIEEVIEYCYQLWAGGIKVASAYAEFYFKLLYFYKLRNIIIFASDLKSSMATLFKDIVTFSSVKIIKPKEERLPITIDPDTKKAVNTSGIINQLKSSLNNIILHWCPTEAKEQYKSQVSVFSDLISNRRKQLVNGKIPAEHLPVGHVAGKVVRIYQPFRGGWYDSPEYSLPYSSKENNLIIGYDDRAVNSLTTKFKIRPPVSARKISDNRELEKGSVCSSSKSKAYLSSIASKIGVKVTNVNLTTLCQEIRSRLIYNELRERLNETGVRWFYFSYEKRPL